MSDQAETPGTAATDPVPQHADTFSQALPPHRDDLHPDLLATRQKVLLLKIVRIAFLILIVTVTALALLDFDTRDQAESSLFGLGFKPGALLVLGVAISLAGLVGVIDWLTPNKKISTLASVFLGLLASMLATYALGAVIDLLTVLYDIRDSGLVATVKVLMGICLAYLGIITVLQTQDEFRLVIPYVEFAKERRGTKPVLLDSSTLIDARVLGIARSGVLQAPLVIPRVVIAELQRLSDSRDELKRARGRRGLDVISQLQREPGLDVTIDETELDAKAVDSQLVELARTMPAYVATTDTGLERVARIHAAGVININALASALKPELVPGEPVSVRVVRAGEQPGQGVGFLPDGTMIVVERAANRINQTVDARVTGSLQTSAGRLIFADPHDHPDEPEPGDTEPGDTESNGVESDRPASSPSASAAPADSSPVDEAPPPARPKPRSTPRNPRR